MMLLKLIFALLILAILAIFAIENGSQKIIISFLTYKAPEVPVVVLIIISVLLGVLLTIPIYMRISWNQMRKVREKKKEIKKLEKEKKQIVKEQPKSLPPAIIDKSSK